MDSGPLRNAEFFSTPNNQTVSPIDRRSVASTSVQQPSLWNTAGLKVHAGLTMPSSAATTLSLDSLPRPSPSTGLTAVSPSLSAASQTPAQGGRSRPGFPARHLRTRDGHERKRSRLSMDGDSPLESVDYWLNFDKDDGLPSVSETVGPRRLDLDSNNEITTAGGASESIPAPSANDADEFLDDSAIDNALSDDDGFSSINLTDQLSKVETAPPQEVPPREGLYSTPLSWERPQPGIRMDRLVGLNATSLNEAEQRRLIAIAMNPGSRMGGLGSNINFNFTGMNTTMPMLFGAALGGGISTTQGPKPVSPPQPPAPQPRAVQSTAPKKQASGGEKSKEKPKTGERAAHNDIERKYRTNLKDKIAELRNAIPSLRTVPEEGGDDDEAQQSRAVKVSKGTVLAKAIEYIHQLERRNKEIVEEHRELSRRLQAFEQLLSAAAQQAYTMPAYSRTLFDPRGFC
ncbi:hypothetical protein VTH06DRAFT_7858 [Thermothelomyces fergusii]